jgi:hypothetical protein
MRLKALHADPGACYIILNSHCCQRSRPLLKFYIDRADILLEGSPGSALLISQKQIVDNRGGKFLVYLDTAPSKAQGLLACQRKSAKIYSPDVNLDV